MPFERVMHDQTTAHFDNMSTHIMEPSGRVLSVDLPYCVHLRIGGRLWTDMNSPLQFSWMFGCLPYGLLLEN